MAVSEVWDCCHRTRCVLRRDTIVSNEVSEAIPHVGNALAVGCGNTAKDRQQHGYWRPIVRALVRLA